MRQLGMEAQELADKASVPYTTVKYFGLLSHDAQHLERLPAALDWPDDRIARMLDDGTQQHEA